MFFSMCNRKVHVVFRPTETHDLFYCTCEGVPWERERREKGRMTEIMRWGLHIMEYVKQSTNSDRNISLHLQTPTVSLRSG